MKRTVWLIGGLIGVSLSLAAQREAPLSTDESTMIGIGGYNLQDTYLSPGININYTGLMMRVLNERMRVTCLADEHISRQQLVNVEFGSTHNGAETANIYAGFVDYDLGYHYRFTELPIDGLKLLTGLSTRISGGFLYNTRNSNNPVSGKADFDLNLSGMAIYNFCVAQLPLTFRYQMEVPFAGVLFSLNKGQPYYFISEGDTEGLIRVSSFHNKQVMRNYFTLDIPVGSFTVRMGYLNSMYRTNVNDIKTHVISNAFMIGIVKEFIAFGGKNLKDKSKYRSAYY
ncbi:MAG: DUF3316 domain-containing protein [Parabacteroides sp.]|nr:DUF3316 domain-containing protein [Parabacteroides sp.]